MTFQIPVIFAFAAAAPQSPGRVDIATAGHPATGPATAPVTIVEFSDFECPFCGRLFPTLKTVEKIYLNRVRIVYRQFPLRKIHPRAEKAAEASLCAADQGRFWEMHDSLFSDQEHLTVDDLKARAVTLKLDAAAFNACLDSGRKVAAIDSDIADGAKAGVNGTPTMFINGRMMPGAQPYATIQAVIEEELQKK
jgi:protein-disulfide isomerase